jgi:hypothetical protein
MIGCRVREYHGPDARIVERAFMRIRLAGR